MLKNTNPNSAEIATFAVLLRQYRPMVGVVASMILVLQLSSPLLGQTFRGSILGTVTDPNGAVVPEANVMARNVGTGLERSAVSDAFGNYTIPELQIVSTA